MLIMSIIQKLHKNKTMKTSGDLFKQQLRDNLIARRTKLETLGKSGQILVDAINEQLGKDIQLPGEIRGCRKSDLESEALSKIIKTEVYVSARISNSGNIPAWTVKIGEDRYITMYYEVYKGHKYLSFNVDKSIRNQIKTT